MTKITTSKLIVIQWTCHFDNWRNQEYGENAFVFPFVPNSMKVMFYKCWIEKKETEKNIGFYLLEESTYSPYTNTASTGLMSRFHSCSPARFLKCDKSCLNTKRHYSIISTTNIVVIISVNWSILRGGVASGHILLWAQAKDRPGSKTRRWNPRWRFRQDW